MVSRALEIDSNALRVLFRSESTLLGRAVHVVFYLPQTEAIEQCESVVQEAVQCGLQVSVDIPISSSKVLTDLPHIKRTLSGISWALIRVDEAPRLGLTSRRPNNACSISISLFPQDRDSWDGFRGGRILA